MKKLVALVLLVAFAGCATVSTPPNATTIQKLVADEAVVQQIINDVKEKCVPQFASLVPTVLAALAIAANPTDVLSDIMSVVKAAPDLYKDGQGVACVIQVVVDDIKAAKPKPGTQAFLQLEMAQQVLLALGPDATASCVASR